MEDATNPSSPSPDYQTRRDAVSAQRVPPTDPVIDVEPEPQPYPELAAEPVPVDPEPIPVEPTPSDVPIVGLDTDPGAESTEAVDTTPADALPGDAAATPTIAVAEERVEAPIDEPRQPIAPVVMAATGPTGGTFTLWMLIYVLAWSGAMYFTLNHPFTRRYDWNTSYWSIAARNIVRDGFAATHGGVYPMAGEGFAYHFDPAKEQRMFYQGHPPLTAWILAGWMKLFGISDTAIRGLPLAFTAFNLILLFALTRRLFGAGAGMAVTVVASLFPMTAIYSGYVNMEPFVMTFMLIGALGYLSWVKSGSKLGALILFIAIIGGCWTDWPMYLFAGLLAIAHFLQRRDLLAVEGPRKLVLTEVGPSTGGAPQTTVTKIDHDEEGEEALPARPLVSSIVLLLLPLAVFAIFLAYLKYNGSSIKELMWRAQDEMNSAAATRPTTAPATTTATELPPSAYGELLRKLVNPRELYQWFIKPFTAPAVLLAVIGLLLWSKWSRRLSLSSGEVARRAGFRLLLCIALTQLVFSGLFARAALRHEFWQYYFIIPVAVLSGGLLTWLTIAGGMGRKFFCGLVDRAGWAVFASIPVLACGHFLYSMQINTRWKPAVIDRSSIEFAKLLEKHTNKDDLILTDMNNHAELSAGGIGFAVPWYADRAIIPHFGPESYDTHSLAGIRNIVARFPGKRVIYLWGDEGPKELLAQFKAAGFKQINIGEEKAFIVQDLGATATTQAAPVVNPPTDTPAKPKPTTKPTTTSKPSTGT